MLEVILYLLYAVLIGAFVVAAWRLRYALRHFRMKLLVTGADVIEEKPTVSVCIPARNEDHAMTDCLQSVIASTYPKLEIIVLDDLSGDNTSSFIKAFAHDGVRFVEGTALPSGWLGKNHALQELAREASGTYLLFMDVDTRLKPDSIEQLVAYAMQEQAAMVSVLPRREDGWRASVFFAPLRYFWEVMFHRRDTPATASSAWMINRRLLLERFGGFNTVKTATQPESKLSASLMADGLYRFLIGTEMLGITYEKKWRSQAATSIRLLFPLLGGNPAHSLLVFLDLLIVASPLYLIVGGLLTEWSVHSWVGFGFYLLLSALYGVYLRHVRRNAWLVGALLWPIIILQEAVLVAVSATQYIRGKVTWKGRLVRVR